MEKIAELEELLQEAYRLLNSYAEIVIWDETLQKSHERLAARINACMSTNARPFGIDAFKSQPMTLFTALDLSAGSKAATEVESGVLVVARIVVSASASWGVQFGWHLSFLRDGTGGGPQPFGTSVQLGEALRTYRIDYMDDKVWLPL